MPRVIDGLVSAEGAGMFTDHPAVLAQFDPIGIGPDLDRAPHGTGHHRVLVVIEPNQARLGDRGGHPMEAIEPPGIGHQAAALGLEGFPDGLIAELWMAMRPGIGNGLVEQQALSSS